MLAVATSGCAKRVAAPHPAEYALRIEAHRILCDDRPFATVETYFCRSGGQFLPASPGIPEFRLGGSCFGLAVLYADGERAWLHRGRNWDRAVEQGKYTATTDTEGKLGGAYDIRLASEGRVRFKLPGTVGTFEFAVEEGVLRRKL